MPPFGDAVATEAVDLRHLVKRGVLIEGPLGRAVVVDREAAAQHQPPAGAAGHGVQQPLGADHGPRELRVLPSGDHRRKMDQHVDALEGTWEFARDPQVGPEDLH